MKFWDKLTGKKPLSPLDYRKAAVAKLEVMAPYAPFFQDIVRNIVEVLGWIDEGHELGWPIERSAWMAARVSFTDWMKRLNREAVMEVFNRGEELIPIFEADPNGGKIILDRLRTVDGAEVEAAVMSYCWLAYFGNALIDEGKILPEDRDGLVDELQSALDYFDTEAGAGEQ